MQTDSLYSENRIEEIYNVIVKRLPGNYTVRPTIYHKELKNDTIINYLSFNQLEVNEKTSKREFEISYIQDSLFLLLNSKLPEFNLVDIKGQMFSSEQLKGKPILINFWATSCSPCVAEIPDLNDLKKRYGDQMNFVAITLEVPDNRVIRFLEKREFNFIILFDTLLKFTDTLKIKGVPKNIFIDKNGYIRFIRAGYNPLNYSNSDEFINIIEKLLKNDS
jgi:thiol-disulfide isomerase/thioredoxin